MKPSIAIFLAMGLLATSQAPAQSRPEQPSQRSPQARTAQAQPAKSIVDPNSVAGWAGQALAFVDKDQLAQLWDGASAVAKKHAKRENFIAEVRAVRKPFGAVKERQWSAVRRQQNAGDANVPAGEYASVETVVLFANNQVKSELVTFRHDEDGAWRFAGYVLR